MREVQDYLRGSHTLIQSTRREDLTTMRKRIGEIKVGTEKKRIWGSEKKSLSESGGEYQAIR